MLLKTHLMFAIFMIILFVEHVNNKFVFIFMVLLTTILPDLDSPNSSYGRHLIFRPLQFFAKHRGMIHSFTAVVILSIILAYFFPVASLGFFTGYSVHLITDSFTKEGIQPFWPLKAKSKGFITTGGRIEDSLFISLILVDVLLFFFIVVL